VRPDSIIGYEQFPKFETVLIEFQLVEEQNPDKKQRHTPRRQDLQPASFLIETFQRYYNILISVAYENLDNCTDSKAKHRLAMGKLNGPAFAEKVFKQLQRAYIRQITYLCEKLGIDVLEDLDQVYEPVDDPFSLPEV
jgi:hypothetical protein